jgi:hypothetical protein
MFNFSLEKKIVYDLYNILADSTFLHINVANVR